jgi:cell division protein FtsL
MTAQPELAVVGEASVGLRVVRRKKLKLIERAGMSRMIPYVIGVVIAITAVVFAVLLEQVVLAQSAFKLAELRADVKAAETLHEELLLEAAKMESPDRIERFARINLGMTDPTSVEYIVAEVDTRSTRETSRSGAARMTVPAGLASGAPAEEGGP